MSFIQDIPRMFVLNEEPFTIQDVQYLLALFPLMDMAVLDKALIRKDDILQRAIRAGVLLCNGAQASGPSVMLSLTQDGRLLLGKI